MPVRGAKKHRERAIDTAGAANTLAAAEAVDLVNAHPHLMPVLFSGVDAAGGKRADWVAVLAGLRRLLGPT